MALLCELLILAVAGVPGSQVRHPDAVEIFDCKFDERWDVNYDGWPDKWERQFGPKLPHYVGAVIEERDGERHLAVRLNGGGAYLQTPLVAVSDSFSYKVEARISAANLKNSRVQLRVEFCSETGVVLQSAASPWLASTNGWEQLHLGPVNPLDEKIVSARVVLEAKPGDRVDLEGVVRLDEVWMARLPKMSVASCSPCNVYTLADDICVTCELSGILESDPDILFELLDASSRTLEGNRVQLEGRLLEQRRTKASEFVEQPSERLAYAGTTSWRPPIVKPGFYKIRVTMGTARGLLDQHVINVAVAPPLDRPVGGEFGWSLSADPMPMDLPTLTTLLPRVGVNWVKLPMWYNGDDSRRGDELAVFADKMASADIEVVGVIDRPPEGTELSARLPAGASIADVFAADQSNWLPLLDQVLTRLSLRVRWWQLGGDEDAGFASLPDLDARILELREKLFRFGQDVNLGVGWKWLQADASCPTTTWEFQQFSASPPLAGPELCEYLEAQRTRDARRWVLVEPLPRGEFDLETRASDLVDQMISAKISGADAIFAAHPFDDSRGLMTSNGTPGELLLPWRTTASLLSGARYLGSLPLPHHSRNRLFETQAGEIVMVIWNEQPTDELLYFGGDLVVRDVWGREQPVNHEAGAQVLNVSQLPSFVHGINASVVGWRLNTAFARQHVPSIFGRMHRNTLRFKNTFAQGVGGFVELSGPAGWQITPRRFDFKLAVGEAVEKPFEILLPFDATAGPVPLRAQFQVEADRHYRFAADMELVLGDGEIDLETITRIDEHGTLLVEQRMANHGPQLVDFKCSLNAPGRRRQRLQVFRLGPSPDVKTYRLPDAEQLIGAELLLRVEEVNGARVLNHRFVVQP